MACPTVSYVSYLLSNSPVKPEEMDWSELYPEFFAPLTQNKSHDDPKDAKEKQAGTQVEFADIGCGYGGLLGNVLALSLGQGEAWVLPSKQVRVRVSGPFLWRPDSSDISAETLGLWPLPWRREGLPQMYLRTWVVLSGSSPSMSHFTCPVLGQ